MYRVTVNRVIVNWMTANRATARVTPTFSARRSYDKCRGEGGVKGGGGPLWSPEGMAWANSHPLPSQS